VERLRVYGCLVALVSALAPIMAQADQIKIVQDGSSATANISAVDTNRISVLDDRIVRLFSQEGLFSYQHDPERGDLYLQIMDDTAGPLSFFVTTEKGYTYKLVLTPANIPSEQLVLRNPAATGGSQSAAAFEVKGEYQETVAAIIRAMIVGAPLPGYEVRRVSQLVSLHPQLTALIVGRYEGAAFVGQQLIVRTAGATPVQLTPDLFRQYPSLAGVELADSTLNPGQIIPINLVIRKGAQLGPRN
jgi:conjugal transfer pilus assembly protein TraK